MTLRKRESNTVLIIDPNPNHLAYVKTCVEIHQAKPLVAMDRHHLYSGHLCHVEEEASREPGRGGGSPVPVQETQSANVHQPDAGVPHLWSPFSPAAAEDIYEAAEAAAVDVRVGAVHLSDGVSGRARTPTLAGEFLPCEASLETFINADLIARGLSPFGPETAALQAGRLMVSEIKKRVERGESFAFETTLSGLRHARAITTWRREGYGVKLVFLRLDSPEIAVRRVAARVTQGGHGVPEAVIRRRFDAGWKNFNEAYKHIVDVWTLYDNSGPKPVMVSEGEGA